MNSRVVLLGVPLDPVTSQEALTRLQDMLVGHIQHHVMTPNSEMLVEAHRNFPFRTLLNRTSLNLPDSAGLLWAAHLTGQHLPERVTGVDTMTALCTNLTAEHPVFLLGAAEGIAARAGEALRARNANLRIAGSYSGSPSADEAQRIIDMVNASGAHVLFVAYGAPKQDMWIDQYLADMPGVRIAMGVGGSFDFLAGMQKRAPRMFQQLHIEWLWRLIREPKRWHRIFTAVIIFPIIVIKNHFFKFAQD